MKNQDFPCHEALSVVLESNYKIVNIIIEANAVISPNKLYLITKNTFIFNNQAEKKEKHSTLFT